MIRCRRRLKIFENFLLLLKWTGLWLTLLRLGLFWFFYDRGRGDSLHSSENIKAIMTNETWRVDSMSGNVSFDVRIMR